ncbi:MAG: glycosyltransferase family 2 protein [Planctomycetota bacterium]
MRILNEPLFSLVMSTLGRTEEIPRLFDSLIAQTCQDFELIVVDQNEDDRLDEILSDYADRLPVRRIRSERGLSRGKNAGIDESRGRIIGFPDDDCTYPPTLLARVAAFLETHPEYAALTGRPIDSDWYSTEAREITPNNVWNHGVEYTYFLRRSLTTQVRFDPTQGVGAGTAFWGAEGPDLLLSAIRAGMKLYYHPEIAAYHPGPVRADLQFENRRLRTYHYNLGKGRLLGRYRYPLWYVAYTCIRPGVGGLTQLLRGQCDEAYLRWQAAAALARGWKGCTS